MNILHIALGSHQRAQAKALATLGSVYTIDWTKDRANLDQHILRALTVFQPQLTFMQLQSPGLVTKETLLAIPGIKVNWTGDVRHPIPQWYIDLAPYFSVTLFNNMTDVHTMRSQDLKADYLNIGFENDVYIPNGPTISCADIVFMGNNYKGYFPLSNYRKKMVAHLKKRYDANFAVYGTGWGEGVEDLNHQPQSEAMVYRSCKIAISLSHFNYERYTSARPLRIMGSGAFCLSHAYQGIEKDFTPEQHLDVFHDLDHLTEQIDYYLACDGIRKTIAEAGCQRVHEQFTWQKRIEDLLRIIAT
ncbi:MAG: glycosyltransferase [Chitinophagales bacterium]|nr:glycosyltransferase [Chitinophagales bacterium]